MTGGAATTRPAWRLGSDRSRLRAAFCKLGYSRVPERRGRETEEDYSANGSTQALALALAGLAFGAGAAAFGAGRSSSDAVVVLCTTAGLAARLIDRLRRGLEGRGPASSATAAAAAGGGVGGDGVVGRRGRRRPAAGAGAAATAVGAASRPGRRVAAWSVE